MHQCNRIIRCAQSPTENEFCSQHQHQIGKISVTENSSEIQLLLNTRPQQAVNAMAESLDAMPPLNPDDPFHHPPFPPSFVGADLDFGFDIDTVGLTLSMHINLAKVSRALICLLKQQIKKNTYLL